MYKLPSFRLLLTTLLLSGCSLPGMQYKNGGSDVWRGAESESGHNPDVKTQLYEITPQLVANMRQRSRAGSAESKGLGAVSKPRPWVYRVGAGDILSVIVWDHPELTNPTGTTLSVESSGRVVRPDGTMFYPHAGTLLVAGQTVEDIRLMVTRGLAHIIENPQVDVRVLEFRSQNVNVVGDVDQPCRLPITDTPMTIIDAMNKCQTIRPAIGNRSLILERSGEKLAIDLHALYKSHDALLDHPLSDGDTLYVEDDRWNRIFVVGEVNRQASLNIPISGMTLADALNSPQVEGLNQITVNAGDLYVFRGGYKNIISESGKIESSRYRPKIFHLNAKSADAFLLADQFELKPRDIVYASSASLVSYSRAASLVIPTITTLLQTGILIDRL